MQIEYHNRLRQLVCEECSRVVVRDSLGNALYVAVEVQHGQYLVSHVQAPKFPHLLRELGIQAHLTINRLTQDQIDWTPPG